MESNSFSVLPGYQARKAHEVSSGQNPNIARDAHASSRFDRRSRTVTLLQSFTISRMRYFEYVRGRGTLYKTLPRSDGLCHL